ncbi:MAG: transcriptional regulator [Actinomycetes bacterium]
MYDVQTRRAALALIGSGRTLSRISKQTGINRSTLREWRDAGADWERAGSQRSPCCRCADPPTAPDDEESYGYLLGLYLGDGCLSRSRQKDVWALRIACDDHWPGLQDECARAIAAVMPQNRVGRVKAPGCHFIQAWSKHWTCLFPQHGPGMKHDRRIELAPWQRAIVEADPRPFLRGLFHSDGCRITNWTEKTVAGQRKRYEYPRYFFSNRSEDILGLCTWALDLLGIPWRRNGRWSVSVARREGVAALDEFVGPKF